MTETNELALAQKPAHQERTSIQAGDFLEIIGKAALDPNVDPQKMHGLLDVQERMMNKQAEMAFDRDMIALQNDLPRIKKDAKIEHRNKQTGVKEVISDYATYEAIDEVIRPILQKHGFTPPRFTSEEVSTGIVIKAKLSHRDGHSESASVKLSIDASGAKNNVQGVGSTISYGKRYLVGMLLNLVFEGEDDDGRKAGFIEMSEDQIIEIKDLLRDSGSDVTAFLKWAKADNVDAMDATRYDAAIKLLTAKLKEKENI